LWLLVAWISVRESVSTDADTLRHYVELYTDPFAYTALLNTLGFTAVTVVVALALGVPIAWLVERTDLGGKSVIITVMTLSVLIPGFFTAMGWLFLAHPRIGMVNQLAMSLFGLPLIIGLSNRIYTFSTYLYVKTNPQEGLPEYGLPAAFATFMVVVALLLSWWYSRTLVQARRYQVVTGKNYRPKLVPLRRWALPAWAFIGAYILLAKLLPLLLLIWAALLPYLQPP